MNALIRAASLTLALAPLAASQLAPEEPATPQGQQAGSRLVPADSLGGPGATVEDIDAYRGARLPYVRRYDEIVPISLDGLDLDADPILVVDGEPIPRSEFRRRCLMYTGIVEVDKHVTRLITLREIEKRVAAALADLPADADPAAVEAEVRAKYLLSDADVDVKLDELKELIQLQAQQQASQAGSDPEATAAAVDKAEQEFLDSIAQSVGMDTYREMLAADAGFEKVFLPMPAEATNDEVWDLSQGPVPEDDPKPDWLPQITWDALSRDENARNLRQFVKTSAAQGAPIPSFFKTNIIANIRTGVIAEMGVQYFFDNMTGDDALPADTFLVVDGQPVLVDDLWPLVDHGITDADVELIVREMLTMRAMESTLRTAGAWLDDEAFAKAFADHEGTYAGTLIPLSGIIIFRGYTSLDRYREHYRYKSAYNAWREGTLTDQELEDHYRLGGRLFFERGTAVVDIAYKSIGAQQFSLAAFDAAQAELMAAFGNAEEGDPMAAFRVAAQDFPPPVSRAGGSERAMQRNPLRMKLTESDLSIFLSGYSMADDLFYNGVPGEVYGPYHQRCRRHAWGAELNAGVWLAQVSGFTRSRPLGPLEGVNYDQAKEDFLDLNYLYWSQECLEHMIADVSVPTRD